jgi:hypothetical protein
VIQLPYDGFLTADEQDVFTRYPISRKELPYFILFHEYSHLIDIIQLTTLSDTTDWVQLCRQHQRIAAMTKPSESAYRNLSFERKADDFAYRTVTNMNMHKQAG